MGGSFGQQKSTSKLQTALLPGIFGEGARGQQIEKFGASKRLGGGLEDIIGGISTQDPFRQPFEQAVLQPQFGATTASEEALLSSISALTGGQSALRGLGPATQGALAQNLAPALIGLRQQQLGNLQTGQQLSQQRRQQSIQGLLELIGLAAPQTVAGQKQKESGFQFGAQLLPSG